MKSPATATERSFADATVTMHERRTSEVNILLTMTPDAKPTTRSAIDDTAATIREVRVNVIDLLAIGMSVASHDGAVSEQSGSYSGDLHAQAVQLNRSLRQLWAACSTLPPIDFNFGGLQFAKSLDHMLHKLIWKSNVVLVHVVPET